MVGITSGYCFAGVRGCTSDSWCTTQHHHIFILLTNVPKLLPQNAVILGCCDIIIATKGSNIGIGGPAMIEGGGIGVFHAKEIGPLSVHVPNGVVDVVAEDEAHAVQIAKQYLTYFQGTMPQWTAADQRVLRNSIPGKTPD